METPLDQPGNFTPQPRPKSHVGITILFNFGIMAFYMTMTSLFSASKGDALGFDAMLIVLHSGLAFVSGIILAIIGDQTRSIGVGLILSSILVFIIGFGACMIKNGDGLDFK